MRDQCGQVANTIIFMLNTLKPDLQGKGEGRDVYVGASLGVDTPVTADVSERLQR